MSQKWSVINEFLGLTIYNLVNNLCKAQDTITVHQEPCEQDRHTPGNSWSFQFGNTENMLLMKMVIIHAGTLL